MYLKLVKTPVQVKSAESAEKSSESKNKEMEAAIEAALDELSTEELVDLITFLESLEDNDDCDECDGCLNECDICDKYDENEVDALYAALEEQRLLEENERLKRELKAAKKPVKIKKVIFNAPYTTIIWNDGTRTVSKWYGKGFNKFSGFTACVAKKFLGGVQFKNELAKWCKEDTKPETAEDENGLSDYWKEN